MLRGITQEVINRYKITGGKSFFTQVNQEVDCIIFPYIKDLEHINTKYRSISDNKDLDKKFKTVSEAESALYGYDQIPQEENSTLHWCEGELDLLSMASVEVFNVVSVPNGAAEKRFD